MYHSSQVHDRVFVSTLGMDLKTFDWKKKVLILSVWTSELHHIFCYHCSLDTTHRLVGLVVKATLSRATDRGSIPAFSVGIFLGRVIQVLQWLHYQMADMGQCWDLLAWCQYTMTGRDRKFDQQFLSQCGSMFIYLSRFVSQIH